MPNSRYKEIDIDKIDIAPENVRAGEEFGEDDDDALIVANIKQVGVFQPITVREDKRKGRFLLLMGRRRLLAMKEKGETTIPAMITDLKGAEAKAASLFENIIRKDLKPLNKAEMIKGLVKEAGGIAPASRKWGIPLGTINDWLTLLRLPDNIQYKLQMGELTQKEALKSRHLTTLQQEKLASLSGAELERAKFEFGIRRGAPKGLLTIRLVWDPRDKREKLMWNQLEKKAAKAGQKVQDHVRGILADYAKS